MFSKETKARVKQKVTRAVESVKSAIVPIVIGTTISCAINGYVQSIKNARNIRRLGDCHNGLCDVVNNNAECGKVDRHRIEELERQNALLLEKALEQTKGEKPAE